MRFFRVTLSRTFRSLTVRNYRLYFAGQSISLVGTWMQSVAQAWLVLRITGSGLALGTVTALQFLPVLLAGPWGGVIADRSNKRRILFATQASAGLLALALGILTVTGVVSLWMVYLLAGLLGVVTLVDMPTRQSFVIEMVGPGDLTNAVSLNSVLVNAARVVGPAAAGALIATAGIGICFLVNAGSYVAVIAALGAMRPADIRPSAPVAHGRGQIREGFRYVRSRPELLMPLLVMAVVGAVAYNFSVLLPLMARFSFGAGAGAFGALFAMMGVGSVLGGLVTAARGKATRELLIGTTVAFGATVLLAAAAPTLGTELIAMVAVGAASTGFVATANSLLQLGADPEMRGRIMALFTMVFLGTTPVGGPLAGWVAERFGPRAALALGAAATVSAGLLAMAALRRSRRATARPKEVEAGLAPSLGVATNEPTAA